MKKRTIENATVMQVILDKGDILPKHAADFKVLACVTKGEVNFRVGEEEVVKGVGEFMLVPSKVEHSLSGNENSIITVVRMGE